MKTDEGKPVADAATLLTQPEVTPDPNAKLGPDGKPIAPAADDKGAAKPDDKGTKPPDKTESPEEKAAREARQKAETPEEKAAREKAEGEAAKAKAGAPEKYEPFVMPKDMELDAAALAKFEPLARKFNLSQEAAQELVDLYANEILPSVAAKNQQLVAETTETWLAAAKADKEYGGEAYDANITLAKKAVVAFGSDELKHLLNNTGLGNHPELIRVFVKIGKAMSEDRIVMGDRGGGARALEDRMFGPPKA